MAGSVGRSGGARHFGAGDATPADGAPIMPDDLSKAAAAKWAELIEQLPSENLRRIDSHLLAQLAVLLSEASALAARIASDPGDDRARRLHLQTLDRISRFSVAFGLTPADRRRGRMETPQADPTAAAFSEWLGKRGRS